MTIRELIVDTTNAFIDTNREGMSKLEGGLNGPYNDKETPLRILSHWLITNYHVWKWTGNDEYLHTLRLLGNMLLDSRPKELSGSYKCRFPKGTKDTVNGLIGQAWILEGLWHLFVADNNEIALQEGIRLVECHNFALEKGLWYINSQEGQNLGIDTAFNHQLWFTMAASYFAPHSSICKRNVEVFMAKIHKNIELYDNGVIYHLIKEDIGFCTFKNKYFHRPTALSSLKHLIKMRRFPEYSANRSYDKFKEQQYLKAIGYQSFNLHAFTRLEINGFKANKIDLSKMRNCLRLPEVINIIEESKYSFQYNAPGFEIPVIESFSDGELYGDGWLKKQVLLTYSKSSRCFNRNTCDSITLNARLYELTFLPEGYLNKEV